MLSPSDFGAEESIESYRSADEPVLESIGSISKDTHARQGNFQDSSKAGVAKITFHSCQCNDCVDGKISQIYNDVDESNDQLTNKKITVMSSYFTHYQMKQETDLNGTSSEWLELVSPSNEPSEEQIEEASSSFILKERCQTDGNVAENQPVSHYSEKRGSVTTSSITSDPCTCKSLKNEKRPSAVIVDRSLCTCDRSLAPIATSMVKSSQAILPSNFAIRTVEVSREKSVPHESRKSGNLGLRPSSSSSNLIRENLKPSCIPVIQNNHVPVAHECGKSGKIMLSSDAPAVCTCAPRLDQLSSSKDSVWTSSKETDSDRKAISCESNDREKGDEGASISIDVSGGSLKNNSSPKRASSDLSILKLTENSTILNDKKSMKEETFESPSSPRDDLRRMDATVMPRNESLLSKSSTVLSQMSEEAESTERANETSTVRCSNIDVVCCRGNSESLCSDRRYSEEEKSFLAFPDEFPQRSSQRQTSAVDCQQAVASSLPWGSPRTNQKEELLPLSSAQISIRHSKRRTSLTLQSPDQQDSPPVQITDTEKDGKVQLDLCSSPKSLIRSSEHFDHRKSSESSERRSVSIRTVSSSPLPVLTKSRKFREELEFSTLLTLAYVRVRDLTIAIEKARGFLSTLDNEGEDDSEIELRSKIACMFEKRSTLAAERAKWKCEFSTHYHQRKRTLDDLKLRAEAVERENIELRREVHDLADEPIVMKRKRSSLAKIFSCWLVK